MKTNAILPAAPVLGQDKYMLFCLDEVGHRPALNPWGVIMPDHLTGCEFFKVRWIDRGSRQIFYLFFHMSSDDIDEILEQLTLVRMLAMAGSITVEDYHNPPNNDDRPNQVAKVLNILPAAIQHFHNGNPTFTIGDLG